MNKKGFTLVELLAVIAILAILVIIALPNVLGMFNTAKKNSFNNELKIIYSAAEETYLQNAAFSPSNDSVVFSRVGGNSCNKELKLSGRKNIDFYIELNRNGKVVKYYASDGTYQFKSDVMISKEDITPDKVLEISDGLDKLEISCNGLASGDNPKEGEEKPPVPEPLPPTPTITGIAVLDEGPTVNVKLKKLAGSSSPDIDTLNNNVKSIVYTNVLKDGFVETSDNTISSSDSTEKVYAWFDSSQNKLYIYSKNETIYLPPNCYAMFSGFTNLTNVNDFSHFNSENVIYLISFFSNNYKLEDLSGISSWNTTNVKSLAYFLNMNNTDIASGKIGCGSLSSTSALENWDVSNVEDMNAFLEDQCKLKDLSGLSNWRPSSLKKLDYAFYLSTNAFNKGYKKDLTTFEHLSGWSSYLNNLESIVNTFSRNEKIVNLNGLQTWNPQNLTNASFAFRENFALKDISALSNWEMKNVTDMSYMFLNDVEINNIGPLSNWNVSKVKSFESMFNVSDDGMDYIKKVGKITSLAPLENWQMNSAENINLMFQDQVYLTGYSKISKWNLSKVNQAGYVFGVSGKGKKISNCNNETKNAKTLLKWNSRITNLANFDKSIIMCNN